MKKIIFSSSAIWWKISNNLFGLIFRKNVFELGIRINLSIHCSGLQLIKQWFDTLLFFLISLIKKEFQYLYNLTEKISINNYETFFRLRSHQCAPPPEEAAALLLVAGLRSSMPLPYSVEQISSRLVSCLWFWRLQPHKKTRQIDLCIVLDLFGGQGDPRGGAQWPPEAVGLQQVGQCDTSERIRGQSKIFWGRRLPIQDWVKPDFW